MPNAASLNDASRMAQAGFRIDRHSATVGDMTWSGDIYRGVIGPNPNNIDPATRGQDYHGSNLLFNWIYNATTLQSHRFFAYLDSSRFNTNKGLTRSALNTMGQQIDNRNIVDLNYQITQRWQPQVLTWGAGYRRVSDNEDTRPSLQLIPMSKIDRTYSTFVQDDISVLKDKGHFILGTKYEHNPYTGSEWQPSVRTTYFIADSLVWAAWSRALRIPTRLEEDLSEPTLIGNTHLKAEAASVYEVGWRKVLRKGINLDVAAYTSKYINLVTVEGKTDGNKMSGRISGIEISPSLQLRPNWLVRFNYSHAIIHMGVSQTSLNKVLAVQTEDSLPSDMSELVSMYDINDQWQLNTFLRYVSQIKFQRVSPYTVLDTSIVWKPTKNISCQLVGRDLGKKHYERGFTTSPLVAPSIALYVTVKV
jgi:iron complex outermembrane receptor protein